MRISKTRHALALLLALALSATALLAATPAVALEDEDLGVSTTCVALAGRTPSVEIDDDNDGDPEYRVPSISDVQICPEDDWSVSPPVISATPCSFGLGCWAIRVTPTASVYADTGLLVCHSQDDVNRCASVNVAPVSWSTGPADTICIGVDTGGQYPCTGWYLTFE